MIAEQVSFEAEQVSFEKAIRDPNNPRSDVTSVQGSKFAESVKKYGIKVPLIGYKHPLGIMVADGHRRLEAGRLAGMRQFPFIVFPHKPSEDELLATQLTINGHREALNPIDEFEGFNRLAMLRNWCHSQLADGLAIGAAEVTRVMSMGKLSPEEQRLVREGKISKSAAYALSRMSADQRAAIVLKAASGEVTRDELNNQARRRKPIDSVKTRRINCKVLGGMVSIQGNDGLDLSTIVDMLDGLLRECRRLKSQGLNVKTAERVLNDLSQAPSVG